MIKLNEDVTKYNIAVTLPKIIDLIHLMLLPKIAVVVELTCYCLVVNKCIFQHLPIAIDATMQQCIKVSFNYG